MAGFRRIVAELKKQERRLAAQLAGIRTAISSLEFGGGGVPKAAGIETPNAAGKRTRKRRKLSKAARAKISAAQKKRWAKVRAAKK